MSLLESDFCHSRKVNFFGMVFLTLAKNSATCNQLYTSVVTSFVTGITFDKTSVHADCRSCTRTYIEGSGKQTRTWKSKHKTVFILLFHVRSLVPRSSKVYVQ